MLAKRLGYELLYLPTYSPSFKPIEHLFAKVFVKCLRPDSTDERVQIFCEALKTITQNIRNSFLQCGYMLEQ